MKLKNFAVAAAFLATTVLAGNAIAVTGDTVHAAYQVSVVPGDVISFGDAVVGPGVEFSTTITQWPYAFDFSEHTLKITFSDGVGFSELPFNGFVFTDLTSNFSNYYYTVDTLNTSVSGFSPSNFTQDENVLRVNMSGLTAFAGETILITSVPEPKTYAMLLAGVGLVGAFARRRQNRA